MESPYFAVFQGPRLLARGSLQEVLPAVYVQAQKEAHALVFVQESTGRTVDFDWRGSVEEVVQRGREQFQESPGRGRPKLGVKSREVTLLPRHWAWLDRQTGSRSAVLRRLVDQEMKQTSCAPSVDAVYGCMSTLAGDLPGFEEASRALFAGDATGFLDKVKNWPGDLGAYFAQRIRGEEQQ